MQFTYHVNSGEENLKIDGELLVGVQDQPLVNIALTISPNPVKEQINVTFNLPQDRFVVNAKILSVDGKVLFEKRIKTNKEFQLTPNLISGNYFLELELDNQRKSILKFVK